jgi:XkdW protein
MTLYDKITQLYPTLTDRDFMTVIALQNDSDGRGDYIAKWDHPTLARPTDEQLAAIKDQN